MPQRDLGLCPCLALASRRSPSIVRPPMKLPASQPGPGHFSIGSFNILTPRFADVDYYPYVPHVFRQWAYRKPLIIERLLSLDVDVLCCQEAAGEDRSLFDALALSGYEAVAPTEPRKGIEKPVTFVRTSKFTVVTVEHRSRASLLALREVCSDEGEVVAGSTPLTLFVANVHLQGEPTAQDARRSQLESVCRRFRKLRQDLGVDTKSSCAVIVGDFNEPAGTRLHGELQMLEAKDAEDGSSGYPFPRRHESWKFLDAYSDLPVPPATFRAEGRHDRIDFIYHSSNLQLGTLRWPLSAEEEERLGWSFGWPPWPDKLPSAWFPSDHVPLAAAFVSTTSKPCAED